MTMADNKEQVPPLWTRDQLNQVLAEVNWSQPASPDMGVWQPYLQHYRLEFGHIKDVSHHAGYFDCEGYRLVLQHWHQPSAKGTAILVHGYYDHVGLYRSLIEFCLQQGWNVIMYDLPGHGLSSGERASIQSFQEYDAVFDYVVQQLQQHQTQPLQVMGQSTGGAIIVNYLLKRQLTTQTSPFDYVTLLAPLVRPKQWLQGRILHSLLSPFLSKLKRQFKSNSADSGFLNFVARHDPLQPKYLSVAWVGALKKWIPFIESQGSSDIPISIIQGDADQTVEWQHNLKVLKQSFPHCQTFMLPQGQHHLVNESEANRKVIYQQIARWQTH